MKQYAQCLDRLEAWPAEKRAQILLAVIDGAQRFPHDRPPIADLRPGCPPDSKSVSLERFVWTVSPRVQPHAQSIPESNLPASVDCGW
jgi:hypothetical protein